jgi:hypothetical protein
VPAGHNGLTEVGSDVAARANVTCTRPIPGPVIGPDGYAVNDQAHFASDLAKGFANRFASQFASITGPSARANRPIPEPLLVPVMATAGTIPPPSGGGISQRWK